MGVLVLDFGGSSLKYAVIDQPPEIKSTYTVDAPRESYEAFLGCIKKIIEGSQCEIDGMAISLAGTIDDKLGYVHDSNAYPFLAGHHVASELSELFHIPVSIGNDSNSAALAELEYGCLKDINNAIVIILGSAIGGTLIFDRKIYMGSHFSAGEFSVVKTNGEDDCLNYVWAKTNGSKGLLKLVQKYKGTDEIYNGVEIFQMANEGDMDAMDAVDEFCRRLAIQIYNIQSVFDTECIAIGGGISAQPLLFKLLDEYLSDIFAREEKYMLANVRPEVRVCEYRNSANLLGAYHRMLSCEMLPAHCRSTHKFDEAFVMQDEISRKVTEDSCGEDAR